MQKLREKFKKRTQSVVATEREASVSCRKGWGTRKPSLGWAHSHLKTSRTWQKSQSKPFQNDWHIKRQERKFVCSVVPPPFSGGKWVFEGGEADRESNQIWILSWEFSISVLVLKNWIKWLAMEALMVDEINNGIREAVIHTICTPEFQPALKILFHQHFQSIGLKVHVSALTRNGAHDQMKLVPAFK